MINRRVFLSTMLTIGLPIIIQQIISLSLNMIDTFMIGSVGVAELAAVGAANKVYFIFSTICFGIYSGASIFVSQYWGIHDVKNIRKVIAIQMRIGFILSVFTCIFICPWHLKTLRKRCTRHSNRRTISTDYLLHLYYDCLFFFNEF